MLGAEITALYDGCYSYQGEVQQLQDTDINGCNATEVKLDPMYNSSYAFACKLPNAVINGSAPLTLTLTLDGVQLKLTIPFDVGFDDIYTLVQEVELAALRLQESEVQAVKWASEAEVLDLLADGRFIPYHRAFIQLLFAMRSSRGAHVSKLG